MLGSAVYIICLQIVVGHGLVGANHLEHVPIVPHHFFWRAVALASGPVRNGCQFPCKLGFEVTTGLAVFFFSSLSL